MPIGAPGRARGSRGASRRRRRGSSPTSSQAIACRSTFPWSEVARAGDPEEERGVQEVGADHARRESGNRSRSARPKNVPEPTEVSPTMKPNVAPITIAITRTRVVIAKWSSSSRCGDRQEHLREEPEAAEDQRGADDLAHRRLRRVGERARDLDADQRERRPSRRASTARAACARSRAAGGATAPKDLKIAPCRMSVPTAVFGSKPKIRISIGVISEPPPIPVMPTSVPTARPAITNCQVMPAWTRPGIGQRDERPPGEAAAELVRLAAGAEAGGGGEQRQRRDEKAER